MKKIIIFSEFPLSAISGETGGRGSGQAATWLPQLAMAWDSCVEFDIHWAVFDRTARKSETISAWNQTFHRIPCTSISVSLLLGRWPHRKAAKSLIRNVQPDLIHVWGTENLFGAALQEFDGPSILSMQGIIHTCFKTGDLTGWRWRLFKHWEAVSLRKASFITSESNWGLDRVKEIVSGKPLRKIEYGVNPSYYDVTWNPILEHPEVIYAGGLCRLKGTDILVEMLKQHQQRPWKFVIAGSGYLQEALQALNDPMIEVLGSIKTQELQARMSRAWTLVHPSRADTSPNVVKEARVIGLPVVGSPHGGHAEYIDNGKDGFIINSEDPEEWFKVLDSLCTDYALCREMGQHRKDFFRKQFRPENTATAFVNLYHQLIES